MIRRFGPPIVAAAATMWLAGHALIHAFLATLGVPCL